MASDERARERCTADDLERLCQLATLAELRGNREDDEYHDLCARFGRLVAPQPQPDRAALVEHLEALERIAGNCPHIATASRIRGAAMRLSALSTPAEASEPEVDPIAEAARNIVDFHIIQADAAMGATLLSMADLKILRRALTRQQEADTQGER